MLTGESGSGKTEAGKLVLQYIAAVTGHAQVGQYFLIFESNKIFLSDDSE